MSVDLTSLYPKANPKICGFTAITEDTTASGCTPDVDGPGYQGYERSFTEQLTGMDVVSGQRLRPARNSFVEAHRAATIEDLAKDIPLATSDFFLWKWALAIENGGFVPRTSTIKSHEARLAIDATVIGKRAIQDQAYQSKEAFFYRMQRQFVRMYPEYAFDFTGHLSLHKNLETKLSEQLTKTEEFLAVASEEFDKNQVELLKQWNAHVRGGKSILSPAEMELETNFFGFFDQEYGPGSGGAFALYRMSMAAITEPTKASALSEYKAKRYQYAIEWALSSGQPKLVNLAQRLQAQDSEITNLDNYYTAIQKRHGHVRRLLIYRQILGAWNSLVKMGDDQALSELNGIIDCETTKLP